MTASMVVTISGLVVAGLSALLGVWVERDPARPPRFAYGLSALILMSMVIGLGQAYQRQQSGDRMEADLARILDDLDQLAATNPEVDAYLQGELKTQVRSHPEVIEDLAERVEARGSDVRETLERRGVSAGDLDTLGDAFRRKK